MKLAGINFSNKRWQWWVAFPVTTTIGVLWMLCLCAERLSVWCAGICESAMNLVAKFSHPQRLAPAGDKPVET